ncbi:MAG: hypothetical protein O3A46_16275 [Candidatus Poribacteria bacterium]|nr:hypothetical protein [Candidatus Poribacteria bacterium]
MGSATYEEVRVKALELTPEEQLRLIQDVLAQLRGDAPEPKTHTIQEFRGVGKELWRSIDVDEYVRKEREAWNG